MDMGEQPLHQKDGTRYIKPTQLMLAGFSKFDPAIGEEAGGASGPDKICSGRRQQKEKQQEAEGSGRSGEVECRNDEHHCHGSAGKKTIRVLR